MASERPVSVLDGLLLIDKPGGMTSHDVVAAVRRITGERSIGHLGTLDPMATGLLPMLCGRWTRLAQFFGAMPKSYTGTIRFGFATDTFDAEGEPSNLPAAFPWDATQLQLAAASMLGDSLQTPPPFSAKKINGRAAYAIARAGAAPSLKPVSVCIESFTVEAPSDNSDGTTDVAFSMKISAGGYVRSVAHALGEAARCGAHLAALRRVAAGPLQLADALTLDTLQVAVATCSLQQALPHPRSVLAHMPAVGADAGTLQRMRNGAQIALPEFSACSLVRVFAGQRELAGIARRVAGVLFQPIVVL